MGCVFSAFTLAYAAVRGAQRLAGRSLRGAADADPHRRVVVGDDRCHRRRSGRRLAARGALPVRRRRGRLLSEHGARLLALAAGARARARLRPRADDGGALGGAADAAPGRALLELRALAAHVHASSASSGWSGPVAWYLVVSRRSARARRRSTPPSWRIIGCELPEMPHRRVPWGRCCADRNLDRALRHVRLRDLRLVLLHHLAADLSAARARLRDLTQVGWLVGAAAARASRLACWSAVGLSDVLARRWSRARRPPHARR